jgi:hypothetical protein
MHWFSSVQQSINLFGVISERGLAGFSTVQFSTVQFSSAQFSSVQLYLEDYQPTYVVAGAIFAKIILLEVV